MQIEFSLLLQEHKIFGKTLQAFLIYKDTESSEFHAIHERLSEERIAALEFDFTEVQKKIIKTADRYNDTNIALRFSSKKLNTRNFIQTVKPDYVAQFIRPFIEKQMAICLDLAMDHKIRIFHRDAKNVIYESNCIAIEPEPADVVFNFIKLDDETRYFQTISHQAKSMNLTNKGGIILCNEPCWLILDQKLFHFKDAVDGKKLELFFNKNFIRVAEKHEAKYYSTFIRTCIRDFSVHTEGFKITNILPNKSPILSLRLDFKGLPALFLDFKYGSSTIKFDNPRIRQVSYSHENDMHQFKVFQRDTNWEKSASDILLDLGLQKLHQNTFVVNKTQDKYNLISWLNQNSEALKKHGFVLEQNFSEDNYYTGTMDVSVKFEEKNDWFDVYAVAKFGDDFEIPVVALRKYLLNKIREFKLPDGRIAILPETWFRQYTDLVTFGEKLKDRLRVNKRHMALVSGSLNQSPIITQDKLQELGRKEIKEKFELPGTVKAVLRNYQMDGFKWLCYLRKHKFGGCLADDMGLGKTLQTLSLLAKHIEKSTPLNAPKAKPQLGQLDLFAEVEAVKPLQNPSIVIMPASLIHNWQNEIIKFTPHIKYLIYTGPQRSELLAKFPQANLILTTYGTVRNDSEEFSKIQFDYVILDESQLIKNPASKTAKAIYKLKATHRLALSGTPIENGLSDLWSQMHFLNPGLLRDGHFFKQYFTIPIEKNNDEEKQNKLHQLVQPFILRRTKAQVEKELPKLSEEYIYCDMSDEQAQIYQEEKIAIRDYILQSFEKKDASQTAIVMVQALTKLRQLANHPILINEDYKEGSGKFEEVIRSLETLISEGHKVLVFSSFVKHIEVFTKYFDENNLKYSLLTGKSRKRDKIIKEFQTDQERNVFFISLKAGGVGLNLTQAEYVFILDPWWNPQAENQAVNRAHRIGQSRPVFAYRFISLGTIEEKILTLQRKKSQLADLFIRTDNPLKGISAESIKELMD